jgi:O-antigen/teichoic acid export membrane protein
MTAMGFTIYLLPLATFVYSIYSAARALAVRKAKFSEIGRAQIWRAVAWSLVWMGLGYSQVVTAPGGGLIIGQVVADLFFAVLLLRGQSPRARLFLLNAGAVRQKQAISAHRGIILSIFLSQLLASFHSRLTLLTIGAVFGPVQVGYYTLSERIVAAPEVASSIIADVYRQRAAQAYFKREKFNRLMLNILGLTLLLSVIPYGIAIYLTPKLVVPILGAEWQPAAFTIKLVLISSLISFNCATVDKSPLIVGAHRYMVIFQAVRLLVEVIPAVCAVVGLLSLEAYLIFIVAGRSLVMIGDTGVGYVLASKVHAVAIPR